MATISREKTVSIPSNIGNKFTRSDFLKTFPFLIAGAYIIGRKLDSGLHIHEKFNQSVNLIRYLQSAENSRDPKLIAEAQKMSSIWCIASAAAYYGQATGLPLSSELLHRYLAGNSGDINLSHYPELNDYLFPPNPAAGPIAAIITDNINLSLRSEFGIANSGASKTSKEVREVVEKRILVVLGFDEIEGIHRFPENNKDFRSSLDHATFKLIPANPNPTKADGLFKLDGKPNSWTVTLSTAQIFSSMTMIDIYNFDPKSTATLPFNLNQVDKFTRKLFPEKVADYLLGSLDQHLTTYLQQGVLIKYGNGYELPVKNMALLETTAGLAKSYRIGGQWPLNRVGPVSFKLS